VSKASYRSQWVTRTLEQLAAQPQWDGVFIDNLMADIQGWNTSSATPNVYTRSYSAAWEAAMQGFAVYVVRALRSSGYYVMMNMNKWASGLSGSDEGTALQGWCTNLGTAIGGSGFGMFVESGWQHPNVATPRLNSSGTYYAYWLNWGRDMVAAIEAGGGDPWISLTWNTNGDTSNLRYARASAAMFWDGTMGGLSWFNQNNYDVTAAAPFSFDLGNPSAAYSVDGNGCYVREFANGWAACNPTATSRTVIVGGVGKVIPSLDGFIGVP
jgi:hypothetical protein